jgi:pSer/pThr/pTyr-binding forkhead associated (FHA) protein
MVQDLGGENGTFVNGDRVASMQKLRDGDRLVVGTHSFVVSIQTETGKQAANQDSFFELTSSSASAAKSDQSDTSAAAPNTKTVILKETKKPNQEAEIMFEIRLDGQRVSVTKSRLFDLARRGSILPDDLITVAGTKVFADSIQGIVFGDKSSAPPPLTPRPVSSSGSAGQAPKPSAPVTPSPTLVADPFAFPDLGNIVDESLPFDYVTSEPIARAARKESSFGVIWKALDISFSRVYTIEGNDLVVHSIKALYYVVVVVCLLGIFWTVFNFCKDWIEADNFMEMLAKHSVALSVVTFGCVTIIVVVRVLIEMLLLAWFESARQDQERRNEK